MKTKNVKELEKSVEDLNKLMSALLHSLNLEVVYHKYECGRVLIPYIVKKEK